MLSEKTTITKPYVYFGLCYKSMLRIYNKAFFLPKAGSSVAIDMGLQVWWCFQAGIVFPRIRMALAQSSCLCEVSHFDNKK